MIDLRRQRFGFVFQQPYLLVWQTAMENVLMGAPTLDAAARRKAAGYFEQLGIAELADKLPSQLSGGEKQRVCVARAMMNDPDVIFADEPTASLDHANGHLVVDLLSAYREQGTVVVVTHDPEMLTGGRLGPDDARRAEPGLARPRRGAGGGAEQDGGGVRQYEAAGGQRGSLALP